METTWRADAVTVHATAASIHVSVGGRASETCSRPLPIVVMVTTLLHAYLQLQINNVDTSLTKYAVNHEHRPTADLFAAFVVCRVVCRMQDLPTPRQTINL